MRKFNGHEINFLANADRIVERKKQGVNGSGYEVDLIVVRHPDGKFYQFEFEYDDEHGIVPTREHPDEEIEAWEVEPVEVKVITYRRKS